MARQADGVAKIADFGVSTCLESDLLTHHAAGTLAFMAPEVRRYFLGEDVSYDATADIWSLGALAVAMLTGNPEPRVATRPRTLRVLMPPQVLDAPDLTPLSLSRVLQSRRSWTSCASAGCPTRAWRWSSARCSGNRRSGRRSPT